jgi:hypothetical protein
MQMKKVTPDGKADNFLLEMELALEAHSKRRMVIYPILVGSEAAGVYQPLRLSALQLDSFPSHPSPTSQHAVRHTLSRLFKLQAIFLDSPQLRDEFLDSVVSWTDDFAWNKRSPNSLKVCFCFSSPHISEHARQLIKHWLGGKDKLDFLFKYATLDESDATTAALPPTTITIESPKVQTAVRWIQEIEGM